MRTHIQLQRAVPDKLYIWIQANYVYDRLICGPIAVGRAILLKKKPYVRVRNVIA